MTNVGGQLDLNAYAALSGLDERRMAAFRTMDRAAQESAIKRMALVGHTDTAIATATGLAVEQIRRILGERA